MHRNSFTSCLALLALGGASFAIGKSLPGSLERARLTFSAADSDRDQQLTFAELSPSGLTRKSFDRFDADGSETWSEADFLLYYSRLLQLSKKPVDPSLAGEVERIRARRKPAREDVLPAKNTNPRVNPEVAKPVSKVGPARNQPVSESPKAGKQSQKAMTGQRAGEAAKQATGKKTAQAKPVPVDPARQAYEKDAEDRKRAREQAQRKPEAESEPTPEAKNLLERAKRAKQKRDAKAKNKPKPRRLPR